MHNSRFMSTALACLMSMLVVTPVLAQVDLSGNWAANLDEDDQERIFGPNAVEYYGLPINDEARSRALSFTTSTPSEPDRQCLYYPPYYMLQGPFGLRLWADSDPDTGRIVAWNVSGWVDRAPVKIWMDGRPEPGADALHPNGGFSTGHWQGDTLVVHTTHMKEGYLRRNGVPVSDQAEATLYMTRHDDLLTVTGIILDPVYLSEPYVLTRVWQYDPHIPQSAVPGAGGCTPSVELPDVADGAVPNYLPGKNPNVDEMTRLYHIPLDAVLGGAQTMYPEFSKKIRQGYKAPAQCTRYCCGWGGGPPREHLQCKGGLLGEDLL